MATQNTESQYPMDCLYVENHLKDCFKNQGTNCIILQCNKIVVATRGAHNPNLQVVIMHSSHECSQHSFGLH